VGIFALQPCIEHNVEEVVEPKVMGQPPEHWSSEVWFMPQGDLTAAEDFGLRLQGGYTHQAKTMMLTEIGTFLDSFAGSTDARSLIIEANILNKRTTSTRLVTFRHLNALYSIGKMPVITQVRR
jgi:hypothetical protein